MYPVYVIIGLVTGLLIIGSGIHWFVAAIDGAAIGVLSARVLQPERLDSE